MAEPAVGGRELRAVINRARLEAVEAGARDIRAEHLLLALLDDPSGGAHRSSAVGELLAQLGLDRRRMMSALRVERAHSLAAAGFTELGDERLTATRLPSTPSMGSSARDALLVGHRNTTHARLADQRGHHQRGHRGRDAATSGTGPGAPRGRSVGHRAGAGEFALAVGVLSAELGTVPRALALTGLDRQALLDAVLTAARQARQG